MPPRKSPPTAEEQSDRLAEAMERLDDRLKNLQEAIDDAVMDITHEVRKLLGEMAHQPLMLRSMPLDPTAQPFKIKEAPEAESVICAGNCDAQMDSLAYAVKAGWSRLTHDPSGMSWNWLGLCGDCQKEEQAEEAPAAPQAPPKATTGTKKRSTLFPDEQ